MTALLRTLCLATITLSFLGFSRADQPNILLIVSDDQGYNDLGHLGNGIITPNLDRLAEEGTRLTDFYVTWPACTPSRSGLLTGRYPQRNGIYDMIRNEAPDYGHKYDPASYAVTWERIGGMDLREKIIPQLLPETYASGIYGKWDLGINKRFLPTSRGFDDFYGIVNTGVDYYTHERYGVPSMYRNLELTEEDKGTYCTYLFEREALKFLNEYAGKQPFFLFVPFNAPHNSSALEPHIRTTVQAPETFRDLYPPVKQEYREVANYKYHEKSEFYGPTKVVTSEARQRDYRAATTCMDESIGKFLAVLDENGLSDNTIVIFFSDNGGSGGADNTPLKGRKGSTWEGGVRVPCLVRWTAGGIPAGAVNNEFLTSLELVPSFAEATGRPLPDDITFDGYNWWPALRGEEDSPRNTMFWKRRDMLGARIGDWKWVDMGGGQGGLFNLAEDIGETNDLSKSHPDRLAELKGAFAKWLAEMEAAEPRGPFRDY